MTKVGVVLFPGSNCEQDVVEAVTDLGGEAALLWHGDRSVGDVDAVVVPGGFAHGDYLRPGAIARFSPVMSAVAKFADDGGPVIGICNGFQVLVKTGYLPGNPDHSQSVTLAANDSGRFQCHWVRLRREKSACSWLSATDLSWDLPIAHGEGKFVTQDAKTLAALEKNRQIIFRYQGANPNGSVNAIAGIDDKVDLAAVEGGFVAAAKAYGERRGISYEVWREAGVPSEVLKKAGITRSS